MITVDSRNSSLSREPSVEEKLGCYLSMRRGYLDEGSATGSRLYNLKNGTTNNTKVTIDGVVVWENGAKVETSATAQ